jgi:hypothetical protein
MDEFSRAAPREGLNTRLEQRFRPFRLADSKQDAAANLEISPEARSEG